MVQMDRLRARGLGNLFHFWWTWQFRTNQFGQMSIVLYWLLGNAGSGHWTWPCRNTARNNFWIHLTRREHSLRIWYCLQYISWTWWRILLFRLQIINIHARQQYIPWTVKKNPPQGFWPYSWSRAQIGTRIGGNASYQPPELPKPSRTPGKSPKPEF